MYEQPGALQVHCRAEHQAMLAGSVRWHRAVSDYRRSGRYRCLGYIDLFLSLPRAVVTWFVTGSKVLLPRVEAQVRCSARVLAPRGRSVIPPAVPLYVTRAAPKALAEGFSMAVSSTISTVSLIIEVTDRKMVTEDTLDRSLRRFSPVPYHERQEIAMQAASRESAQPGMLQWALPERN